MDFKQAEEVTDNMEKFELGLATAKIYDFIWSEYCDWYIEMAKPRLYGEGGAKGNAVAVLKYVLECALKLLHPFMPFITEEIYVEMLHSGETIMTADWPKADPRFAFEKEEADMAEMMEAVRSIRNTRAELNVPPSKKAAVIIRTEKADVVKATENYFKKLASAESVTVIAPSSPEPQNASSNVVSLGEVFLPLGQLVDKDKELDRLCKEKSIRKVKSPEQRES